MSVKVSEQVTKAFIIAEAGVNHNGSIRMAMEMVRTAAKREPMQLSFKPFVQKNWFALMPPRLNTKKSKPKKMKANMK